jgi:hypothetical protein
MQRLIISAELARELMTLEKVRNFSQETCYICLIFFLVTNNLLHISYGLQYKISILENKKEKRKKDRVTTGMKQNPIHCID